MTSSAYNPDSCSASTGTLHGLTLPPVGTTLIDFTLPPTDKFNFAYSPQVHGEGVLFGRCVLPPNPQGALMGSTHTTVVVTASLSRWNGGFRAPISSKDRILLQVMCMFIPLITRSLNAGRDRRLFSSWP